MSDESKAPKIPNVKPEADPADAFKRVEADEIIDPPKPPKASKKKANAAPPREPKPEAIRDEEEISMDPLDAAEEIIGLCDNLFMAVSAIRGYEGMLIEVAPGRTMPLLDVVKADEIKKARLRKALARLMQSAGTKMSPAAAWGLGMFTCYGAPIIAMEMARASAKKGG